MARHGEGAMRAPEFLQDEEGSVAVVFAVGLVVAVGAVSTAVDYLRIVQMHTQVQQAADQAILSAVAGYVGGQATQAERKLATKTVDGALGVANARVSLTPGANGQLCAQVTVPMKLLMLANLGTKHVGAQSCAANNSTYEIALALDNTGSMAESANGQSKIQALQAAATSLVQAINPVPSAPAAAISVVPFASSVNVGANYYTSGASWLDRFGQSSIHWQNYARPAGASWTPGSRFDVYAAMGATWGGCVEERPAPYTTSDAPASAANPDSLFVPYLAPDDAGPAVGETAYAFTPSAQYPATQNGGQYLAFNSYLDDSKGLCAANDVWSTADAADPVSHGSGASKLCKYKSQTAASVLSAVSGVNGGSDRFPAGPNLGCSTVPLQPLTTDMGQITGTGILSKMTPNGDTSLLPGFMWAWRTISPNGPFTGASGSTLGSRAPKPYGVANNTKIVVLMTDGFDHWVSNPWSPYQSMYSALGFYVNNRVSTYGGAAAGPTTVSNYRAQMDAALVEACGAAKAVGVQIYTVGFSVPSNPIDAQGIGVLQACASRPGDSYLAADAAGIVSTFKTIASNIVARRITR